ncbi:ATP-dependent RNA helicase RhlE [Halopseudomonas salegens]|uniref:DEAD-box ATP-dependent RNA helicase RhpA n=1 Tax=Halopseudomonas salegens TaxID=1434072 RepID=A0A1H2DXS7_9GAMM|nr:ATP-dependent RNA helicase RhlE [Halopseudomonas salegens]
MSFASLGLSDALLRAVATTGYTTPTPVQLQAIPTVLQGRDLMVAAQTGTGKTGGFALPMLELLFPNGQPSGHVRKPRQVRALVLTPTRELAAQVHESITDYATELPLKSACVFGGVGPNPQVRAIAPGLDILVACPGRLLDLANQKLVDLSQVEILVLDEADRMLDMGFIHDVKKVIARLPGKRQNLLFSATFSKEITELANRLLNDPQRIEVTPPNTTVERIEQKAFRIQSGHKRALLAHLITQGAWEQVLVFTRTKHGANRLAEYLNKQGLTAAAIHGNKSQSARTKALKEFKAGTLRIMVATDIAARGLDIDQLPHVVNFELPNVSEDYVHRIGRTGRAGRSGEAVSLVSPDEEKLLKSIERMTRQQIETGDDLGFVAPTQNDLNNDRPERAERSDRPRGNQPSRKRNADSSKNGQQPGRAANGKRNGPKGPKPAKGPADQPRSNQPRRPQRAARPVISEPDDAVARERRLQAFGNRAVPDPEEKPARNNRRKGQEKPALFGG